MSTIRIRSEKPEPRITAFSDFMAERHRVYLRRATGAPPPWTKDKLLQKYRFTNVYRELDKVTIWVRKNIREPFADHPYLWFMLCAARQINWPDTLRDLLDHGALANKANTWNWKEACEVMRLRQKNGEKVYTGAYMLRGPIQGDASGHQDKPHYTTLRVLQPIWEHRRAIESGLHDTLERAHEAFMPFHGWGGFLSYEVVSDLRWTRYLQRAPDIVTWAHAGPGARRGLNRLFSRPVKKAMSDEQALEEMRFAYKEVKARWPKPDRDGNWPALEMREIEHQLCEWDKYERARLGEGRPKQMFDGG